MKTLILLLGLSISTIGLGQRYNTAIGVKGGYYYTGGGALSFKHFFNSPSALELNVGGGLNHLWVQGMYERNMAFANTKGLDWYWGLGGDLGVWSGGYRYYYPRTEVYYVGAWGGADALIGLEYTFPNIPINLAVDAGPTIRLFPYVGFGLSSAVALRFAIK